MHIPYLVAVFDARSNSRLIQMFQPSSNPRAKFIRQKNQQNSSPLSRPKPLCLENCRVARLYGLWRTVARGELFYQFASHEC
jgi:hypothetical protein